MVFFYRDEAGSTYHQELARELAEFLENVLVKDDKMMSLTDIYCIFNKARGVGKEKNIFVLFINIYNHY